MEIESRTRQRVLWAISGLLALLFVVTGASKLAAVPGSTANFARWGFSVAFMRAVGAVEVSCGLALLVPRAAIPAAIALFFTMGGALRTGFVYRETLHIALPLALLVLLAVVLALRGGERLRARRARD